MTSLTFDLNGGNVGGVTTDIEVEDAIIGSNILDNEDLPEPVYTGYTLVGWAYDALGATMVGAGDNITEDGTIYAIWEKTIYTVTYSLNGGTNDEDNPSTFVITDLPITLGVAVKADNTFNGWYTEAEFISEVTTISTVGNKSLFAKFTGN